MEPPIIGNLWIINIYSSTDQDLNYNELFDSNPQSMFICGDFSFSHQELKYTYNIENGKKVQEIIDDGNFKLLNNGY